MARKRKNDPAAASAAVVLPRGGAGSEGLHAGKSAPSDEVPDQDHAPLSPEDMKMHEYWVTLAACLGYNELAKLGKSLGEKMYFRLLRDQAVQRFVEVGGNADVFAKETGTVEIHVPYANAPSIKLRPQDVELMRDEVYKHDLERRASPT